MKIRAWVRELAGNPPFAGSWVLVEHWLLVATVPALASLILWSLLARGRMLVKPSDSLRLSYARKATWTIGLGAGLAFALFVLLFVFVCSQAGLGVGFRVACPSFWEVAGNMVSNFLEEIIYRGFLLIGLWVVSGRCWVGIVASSLVFGLTHTQNDFIVQTVIALGGAVMAWAYVRTRSLWSAWTVHMIFDLAADIFLGAGA
jgi:membrane protease YdiL (CAAX protease family)